MAHPMAAIARAVVKGGGLGLIGLALAPLHTLAEPPPAVAGAGGDSAQPALRVPSSAATAYPSTAEESDRNASSNISLKLSIYSPPMERVWTFLSDRATMPLGMAPLAHKAEGSRLH